MTMHLKIVVAVCMIGLITVGKLKRLKMPRKALTELTELTKKKATNFNNRKKKTVFGFCHKYVCYNRDTENNL